MDVSDIVIDSTEQSRNQRNKPFVIRSSPCGKPGEYMQLTPEYLTDATIAEQFGSYEKVCKLFSTLLGVTFVGKIIIIVIIITIIVVFIVIVIVIK